MRLTILLALALPPLLSFAGTPRTVMLDVRSMDCAVCPITIRKALERVPGVNEAKVDFDRKTATVTYDPERATPDALIQATTQVGYPSTLHP
ncbi:mercuric ion binding protein [Methylomagnum ishizawai]|uniref:Periplasmic mercury ion-binding protein n=1 Tax=Methylomagnum ishizawai TaxID=1760988 RepID=A0A1Y6CXL5_9GAMM|nr:mercury resistance system periplasmic binding protein MerP [Methylomagnum ishizawai]SMF95016.1 mercuric ion binding protein [Methylomagnum ishizawai]